MAIELSFWPLSTILTVFEPFLGYFGMKVVWFWSETGQFWSRPGSFWGNLLIILNYFGVILVRVGVVLTPFWGLFWALFSPSLGHFSPLLRHFTIIFRGFGDVLGSWLKKNKQNGARGSGLRIQQECVISRAILLRLPWNLTGMLIREPSQWSLFGSRCSAYSRMYTTHGGDPSQQKC